MNVSDLKIHHIGVAVASVETAATTYVEKGYLVGEKVFDPLQGVNICFAYKPDEIRVELIEPASENSPVSGTIAKSNGEPQVCHICYAVADIEKTIADLRKESWLLVLTPPFFPQPLLVETHALRSSFRKKWDSWNCWSKNRENFCL